MFITKKNFEKAIHEAKCEVAHEWERKMCDMEKRMWDEQDRGRMREEYYRRMDALENRIFTLEKKAGLVEETKNCPYEAKRHTYF